MKLLKNYLFDYRPKIIFTTRTRIISERKENGTGYIATTGKEESFLRDGKELSPTFARIFDELTRLLDLAYKLRKASLESFGEDYTEHVREYELAQAALALGQN